MITKLYSIYRSLSVQLDRVVDHLYRKFTGLPQLRRMVITPNLYLGGQYSLKSLPSMKKNGVTAIVNMRMSTIHQKVPLTEFRYLHLPTIDHHPPTIQQLDTGVSFIQKEIDLGGKVYIHCKYGEGRGPSMAIAYLVSTGLTVDDAIEQIKKVRTFIKLYPAQYDRLKEFEKHMQVRK